jgi:hypothetical protein
VAKRMMSQSGIISVACQDATQPLPQPSYEVLCPIVSVVVLYGPSIVAMECRRSGVARPICPFAIGHRVTRRGPRCMVCSPLAMIGKARQMIPFGVLGRVREVRA